MCSYKSDTQFETRYGSLQCGPRFAVCDGDGCGEWFAGVEADDAVGSGTEAAISYFLGDGSGDGDVVVADAFLATMSVGAESVAGFGAPAVGVAGGTGERGIEQAGVLGRESGGIFQVLTHRDDVVSKTFLGISGTVGDLRRVEGANRADGGRFVGSHAGA